MEKLKVGIAGVGRLGRYHGQNLLQIPSANLVGIYDIDKDRGQRVASELGVEYFSDYLKLLNSTDAVSVAVPTKKHFELCECALDLKKAVFVEKPITATVNEAQRLIELAENNGLVLQVGHIERFNPAFKKLDMESLKPKFIETHRLASFDTRGTDVAVVLDLMIHDIDLTLSIVDSPISHIDASGVTVISDTEDIANARIQFRNGCVANLTTSRISLKKMRKMRLFQKDLYISLDLLAGLAEIYKLKPLADLEPAQTPIAWGVIERDGQRKQIVYNKVQSEGENALKAELQAFIDAVLQKDKPVVSGEDGLKALEVANIILNKIRENQKKIDM